MQYTKKKDRKENLAKADDAFGPAPVVDPISTSQSEGQPPEISKMSQPNPDPAITETQIKGIVNDTITSQLKDGGVLSAARADVPITELKVSNLRDERGLLTNIEYKYKPNGYIDWRAMVKPEYLVVNKEYKDSLERRHNKPFEEISVDEVRDSELLILLSGLKDLAQVRGYESIRYSVPYCTERYAIIICTIVWVGNFETSYEVVSHDGLAHGCENTVSDKAPYCYYIPEITQNRAFCRAVRDFLGIYIVGKDEVAEPKREADHNSGISPHNILQTMVEGLGDNINFEIFRNRVQESYSENLNSDPAEWSNYASIPKQDVFLLMDRIKKAVEDKKKKK